MELTDADFNMRKKFYEESRSLAKESKKEEKKVAIRFKCPKHGFITTTNTGQCLSCKYRPKDLKDLLE